MFLKKDKKKNGRIYLTIVEGFRDPITKKTRQRAVQSLGYVDELAEEFEDPIAHFTQVAKEMTANQPREESKRSIMRRMVKTKHLLYSNR